MLDLGIIYGISEGHMGIFGRWLEGKYRGNHWFVPGTIGRPLTVHEPVLRLSPLDFFPSKQF